MHNILRISIHSRYFHSHFIRILLSCVFLTVFILIVGYGSNVFVGPPKGYDAFNHLAVMKIIKENFPHIFWNAYWDKGEILYPRAYPPLYHFSLGIFAKFVPVDLLALYKWTSIFNLILTSIFLFFIVWLLSRRLSASLLAGLFYPSCSAVWFYFVTTGLYSRIFAMMMLSFGILVWLYYFQVNANDMRREITRMDANPLTGSGSNRAYLLAILGVTFVLLSHFLVVVMFGIFLLLFFLGMKGDWQRRLLAIMRVIGPAILLSAFFYVPFYFMTSERILGEFGKEIYKTISFWSFFKTGTYPGFPLLSIPLAFFLLVFVFLIRGRIKAGPEARFFWPFGLMFLLCLFYSLGIYRHYFSGTSPDHFLLPTAFFLALFLGLGMAILAESGILIPATIFLLLVVLSTLGFLQIPILKRNTYEMFAKWPSLGFVSIDNNRLYRFGHRDEVLGAAFNYYSMTLQTRGYFVPSLLFTEFHNWYEESVFLKKDNLSETKFLLDWFGVRGLYIGKEPGAQAKFGQQREYVYQEARPILLVTNSPVLLFKEDWQEYQKFLKNLALADFDSRFLIPIWDAKAQSKDFTASVIEDIGEIAENGPEGLLPGQEAKFIHSGKREIVLKGKFAGLLFKESYYPRWKATAETQNGDGKTQKIPLKIFLAGTGMMYVPLPESYALPAKVVFEYRVGWEEKTGVVISIGTVVGLVVWFFALRKQTKD